MSKLAQEEAMKTVYLENRSDMHDEITRNMVKLFAEVSGLGPGSRVLDVGCGMGPAWGPMRELGVTDITAITPNREEYVNALASGVTAYWDSLSEFYLRGFFSHVWCRHVLEHTVSPFDALLHITEEIVAPGGWLYVEVPAPDTVARHEDNPNHYSVLGDRMWQSLFKKAGFEIVKHGAIDVNLAIGPDKYLLYILKKPDSAV